MEEVKFEQPTQYLVMQEYIDTVLALSKRFKAFDEHIQKAASESVFWPVIEALMGLRGVNLLAATTVVAEIGDLKRLASAHVASSRYKSAPPSHASWPGLSGPSARSLQNQA
jgi:transposase